MPYSISSVYEPVTFQEMITPNLIAKEEAEKKSEGYLKLLEDMRSIDDLRDSQVDREDYDRYIEFKSRINDMVGRIADNDVSRDVMSNLSKYRAEYQSDFAGLVDKIKRRGELVREQREYGLKYPGNFFDRDYSTIAARDVGEGSTYNVYDMTSAASDVSGMIYNALSSGKGSISEDTVNSVIDSVKGRYGFDGLNDENKRKVLNAITTGLRAGEAAYVEQSQKNALNDMKLKKLQADTFKSMYGKYMGTGQSVRSGSGKTSGKAMILPMPDGNNVKFTEGTDVNGRKYYEYTTVDGKKRILTGSEFDAVSKEAADNADTGAIGPNTSKFFTNYFGGYTPSSTYSGNKFGVNITVYEKNGALYILNSKNDYVPVNGTSDQAIYSAYTGISPDKLPLFISSGSDTNAACYLKNDTSMPIDSQTFDYELNPDKTLFADNIHNVFTTVDLEDSDKVPDGDNIKNNVKEYIRNVTGTSEASQGMAMLERAGFHITLSIYYKNNKIDRFKGYKIELKRNDSGDSARVGQQGEQGQSAQDNNGRTAPSQERNDTAAVTSTEAYDD